MLSISYQFYSILAVGLIGSAIVAGVENKSDDVLLKNIQQVVFFDGERVNVTEMFKLLELSEKIYSNEIMKAKYDEFEGFNKKKEVSDLFQASQIRLARCNASTFARYSSMIQDCYPARNRERYLEYYRDKQLELCKPTFESDLQLAVEQLTNEAREDMKLLKDTLILSQYLTDPAAIDNRYCSLSRGRLVKGLSNFMKSKAGSLKTKSVLNRAKGKKGFAENFKKFVIELCNTIDNKLEPSMEIFDYFDKSLLNQMMQEFTLNWITSTRICRKILRCGDSLINETFEASFAKKNTIIRGCSHVLGCLSSETS